MSEQGEDLALVYGLGPMPNGYFTKPLGPEAGESLRSLQVGLEVKDLFADAQRNWPARSKLRRAKYQDSMRDEMDMIPYRAVEPAIEFVTGMRFRRPNEPSRR